MNEKCNCGYPDGHAKYCPLRHPEEYTPMTEMVRHNWGAYGAPREEFDRWLASVERAAAEKAWGEGHIAGRDYQGDGWNQDAHDPSEDNPYRAAALGLTAEQEGEAE